MIRLTVRPQAHTLQKMTPAHLVVGIIAAKPDDLAFRKEALCHGLTTILPTYALGGEMMGPASKFPSKEPSLETLLSFMVVVDTIRKTEKYGNLFMPTSTREQVWVTLHKEYGSEALGQLRTLAEEVWEKAQGYRA